MRVFLDTNVLVSAFATRGLSADLLELVLVEHEMVTGRRVLKEFERVLRSKLKLPASRCAEVVEFVAGEAAVIVEDAAPAECEVVALGSIGSLRILTPRQLWELLRSDEQAGK